MASTESPVGRLVSLTFAPPPEAHQTLGASWGWLLRAPFTLLLFSSLGSVIRCQSDLRIEDRFWVGKDGG